MQHRLSITHPKSQPLPRPLERQRSRQLLQHQVCWLLARQHAVHDVRRQQRQPNRPRRMTGLWIALHPTSRPWQWLGDGPLSQVSSFLRFRLLGGNERNQTFLKGHPPDVEKRLLIALRLQGGKCPHIPQLFVRQTSEILLVNTTLSSSLCASRQYVHTLRPPRFSTAADSRSSEATSAAILPPSTRA